MNCRDICKPRVWLLVPLALALAGATQAGDPDAAERQYRIARRLAAEGSAEAAVALRKVVELAPQGPLADDAMLEQALLEPLPRWPEQLGRIDAGEAGRARALIDRLLDELSQADRAPEARYYRALLRLEPLPGHDPSAARFDLITVATTPESTEWTRAARYAVAWLAERLADEPRAAAAYQRLLVDAPRSVATHRAKVGLARLLLRGTDYGRAARLLAEAAEHGVGEELFAEPLRELAVRSLLRAAGSPVGGALEPVIGSTDVRSLAGLACAPDGGVFLADRKEGRVVRLDASGRATGRWAVDAPSALAVNQFGRAFVAADDSVYRLEPQGGLVELAQISDYEPAMALAADGSGRVWVLDRKGETIGRIDPSSVEASKAWESPDGARLASIAWDGQRLVAVDARQKRLLAIALDGSQSELVPGGFQKPVSISVDPTRTISILDTKARSVMFYSPEGRRVEVLEYESAGVKNAVAIGAGLDGALHLFDEATGAWMRRR